MSASNLYLEAMGREAAMAAARAGRLPVKQTEPIGLVQP